MIPLDLDGEMDDIAEAGDEESDEIDFEGEAGEAANPPMRQKNKRWGRHRRMGVCLLLTGVLVLLMMILIFSFSAQDATESSGLSSGICGRIVRAAQEIFGLAMSPGTGETVESAAGDAGYGSWRILQNHRGLSLL